MRSCARTATGLEQQPAAHTYVAVRCVLVLAFKTRSVLVLASKCTVYLYLLASKYAAHSPQPLAVAFQPSPGAQLTHGKSQS